MLDCPPRPAPPAPATAWPPAGFSLPSLEAIFPLEDETDPRPTRNRPRHVLWQAVHADPAPLAGLALVQCLAFAVLQANGLALRVDMATALTRDAVLLLRQRRAPHNAQERAAALGMRKARYLALRAQLVTTIARILATDGGREPEISADRHSGS